MNGWIWRLSAFNPITSSFGKCNRHYLKVLFQGIHPYTFLCGYMSMLSEANLVYPHAKLKSARSLVGQENVKIIYTHQRVDWNLTSFGLLPKCWIFCGGRIGKLGANQTTTTTAFPVFCLEGVSRSLFHDLPFPDFNALHQVVTKTCCRVLIKGDEQ